MSTYVPEKTVARFTRGMTSALVFSSVLLTFTSATNLTDS